MIKTFRDLLVWQKGMDLACMVYAMTAPFPPEERYGLASQMRRAAVSIPSNIAEGKMRGSETEFKRYLQIAFASAGELDTQFELAVRIGYTTNEQSAPATALLNEIVRMLNQMIFNRLPT